MSYRNCQSIELLFRQLFTNFLHLLILKTRILIFPLIDTSTELNTIDNFIIRHS